MKLTIKTLTGEKHELEVSPEDAVKHVKKCLYQTGKINSAVRLLQGQTVLQDDRKLSEYNITQDGAVISALFEPDVDINIEVSTGKKTSQLVVPNSTSVMALKVQVFAMTKYGVSPDKMVLLFGDTELENEMPLNYYGLENNSTLIVLNPFLGVTIEDNKGAVLFKRIERKDSIREVKDKLNNIPYKTGSGHRATIITRSINAEVIRLYKLTDNEEYIELYDDMTVDDYKIKDGEKLYLVPYMWQHFASIETLTGDKVEGVEEGESMLSVKLRAQDQLGIPAKDVKIVNKYDLRSCHNSFLDDMSVLITTEEELKEEISRRKERARELNVWIAETARRNGTTVDIYREGLKEFLATHYMSIETILRDNRSIEDVLNEVGL